MEKKKYNTKEDALRDLKKATEEMRKVVEAEIYLVEVIESIYKQLEKLEKAK